MLNAYIESHNSEQNLLNVFFYWFKDISIKLIIKLINVSSNSINLQFIKWNSDYIHL